MKNRGYNPLSTKYRDAERDVARPASRTRLRGRSSKPKTEERFKAISYRRAVSQAGPIFRPVFPRLLLKLKAYSMRRIKADR